MTHDFIDIVFAKTTDPNPDFRFVEVEDANGASAEVGEWLQIEDGYWVLRVPMGQQWQPIETVPKGELVSIWITGTNAAGQRWMDGPGEMWAYCYYDRICGEWRTTRPSGYLRCVPERFVTHWMPLPEPPKDKR